MTDRDNGWHLQKNVSVGHILTTLVVAISAVFWLSAIQSSVTSNTTNLSRIVRVLDTHVASGPHTDAEIRLTRLEVLVEEVRRNDVETLRIIREIRSEMRGNQNFFNNGPYGPSQQDE